MLRSRCRFCWLNVDESCIENSPMKRILAVILIWLSCCCLPLAYARTRQHLGKKAPRANFTGLHHIAEGYRLRKPDMVRISQKHGAFCSEMTVQEECSSLWCDDRAVDREGCDVWSAETVIAPRVFILGCQKCGSTSLHSLMLKHPSVMAACGTADEPGIPGKEVHFFDVRYHRGAPFFYCHFPRRLWPLSNTAASLVSVDATPDYLPDSRVPKRLFDLLAQQGPTGVDDVRLLVILRDPTERLWSYFQMASVMRLYSSYSCSSFGGPDLPSCSSQFVKLVVGGLLAAEVCLPKSLSIGTPPLLEKWEAPSLWEDIVSRCNSNSPVWSRFDKGGLMDPSLPDEVRNQHSKFIHAILRGLYLPQIVMWKRQFPGKQLKVYSLNTLHQNPLQVLQTVINHVGLPHLNMTAHADQPKRTSFSSHSSSVSTPASPSSNTAVLKNSGKHFSKEGLEDVWKKLQSFYANCTSALSPFLEKQGLTPSFMLPFTL